MYCALWTKKATQNKSELLKYLKMSLYMHLQRKLQILQSAFSSFKPKNSGHLDQPRPHSF